ncbi:hypothetical protein ILYODFUR_032183 [Ilyodon furcidens]|uniref:Uncharacterized protein n=1 Tax=Ilyodon furcidens TaxID=33524 RepID=A0ABV0UX16_9TELE
MQLSFWSSREDVQLSFGLIEEITGAYLEEQSEDHYNSILAMLFKGINAIFVPLLKITPRFFTTLNGWNSSGFHLIQIFWKGDALKSCRIEGLESWTWTPLV